VATWLRRKSFRVRMGALVAAAVGATLALAALASYFAVRHQLYGQVNSSLQNEVNSILGPSPGGTVDVGDLGRALRRFNNSSLQLVSSDGTVIPITPGPQLPVNQADASLAQPGPV
jgi:hypothetical protein